MRCDGLRSGCSVSTRAAMCGFGNLKLCNICIDCICFTRLWFIHTTLSHGVSGFDC